MKWRALLGLAFSVVAVGASPVRANGFYVSVAGSAVQRNSMTEDFNSATDPFGNRAFDDNVAIPYRQSETYRYKVGGEGDIAGGYRFGLGRYGALRTELEVSFREYQLGDSSVTSLPGQIYGSIYKSAISTLKGDDQIRYAETVNAFYDLPQLFGILTPYVGAGVGDMQGLETSGERLHVYQAYNGPPGAQIYGSGPISGSYVQQIAREDEGGQGTWQVEGGVSLPLTRHLSLVPAYRYTEGFHGRDGVNVARIGLRYDF